MTQLILACDVSNLGAGLRLIDETAAEIDAVKLGLEAMTAEDAEGKTLASAFRTHAIDRHNRAVMWDMKIHDVENTMKKAALNIATQGSKFFTIHAAASDSALAAVAEAAGNKIMPLAVTVLTDLDEPQCKSRFGLPPKTAVKSFAKHAYSLGIKGFVCSGEEASCIREALPDAFIVTPGIRPEWSVSKDEQKRVTTPTQAARSGASAIVVGRPIYLPPPSYTALKAAREIQQELAAA